MNPGRLRETVTLQNPTAVTATDERTPSGNMYETVGSRRAEVTEDAGGTDIRAGRHEPRQRVTLRMRWWDEVSTASRFKWNSKTLYVTGIKAMDAMRRWMEVRAYIDEQE